MGALAFTAVVLVACVGVDIFQILYTRKKRFYIRSEGNREKLKMCYQCFGKWISNSNHVTCSARDRESFSCHHVVVFHRVHHRIWHTHTILNRVLIKNDDIMMPACLEILFFFFSLNSTNTTSSLKCLLLLWI